MLHHQNRLVRACIAGMMLSGAALISTNALAQTATNATTWWTYGTIEVGGRFFLNNPSRNGLSYLGQQSLAKYYEYSTIKPGMFGNIYMATGSNDGLYRYDFAGKNIGYSDQSYWLDGSKAGQHYFSFGWDQTPHVYSTSALTFYNGIGTNALTLPSGFAPIAACANNAAGVVTVSCSGIAPFLRQTDIGIERDTASVDYRWTPSDAWDVRAEYSHMHRYGTLLDGVVGFGGTGGSGANAVQVPRPVNDTTQNYAVSGEYAGASPWGQRFTLKAGYNGSQFSEDNSSYTIANPFTTPAGITQARLSLFPSNKANSFDSTLAADLPLKSRYVGTVSYTMMRQDADFQPMSASAAFALPAASLNGGINTTLINNVLTTQIAPDLRSKLSYRYYDFKNNTPELFFPTWIPLDGTVATGVPVRSLSMSYTKHNAGAELNWRPSRAWNLTAAYGFERYQHSRVDSDATNENSGKLSADWKPTSWITARASGYYAIRRYQNYDHISNAAIQFPTLSFPASAYVGSPSYRQFMFDNRERTIGNFAIDIVAVRNVTITPNFKYQDDNYGLNPNNQAGLTDRRTVSWGVDVGYKVNPDLLFTVAYYREHIDQSIYSFASATGASSVVDTFTSDKSNIDTLMTTMNYAVIPNKLDFDLRYTLSWGVDDMKTFTGTGAPIGTGVSNRQFPTNTTHWQRLDATTTYKFDRTFVSQMGWKGDVKAKMRYVWERNSVANWQNDSLAPFDNFNMARAIFLGYSNPNYNVHLMAMSLAWSW
jgi:MtrB/PioB family decaheme-associated outer membrane protein